MDIDRDAVWKLLDKAHAAFLTTKHGDALAARPMAIYARPAENAIYMLTSATSEKDAAIETDPHVGLTLQEGTAYLSVSGRATVSHDTAKIRELWSPFAKAWWESPDDPDIRLLTLTPDEAHYWKTPGKVVAMASMLLAAATDGRPDTGEEKRLPM